jgi:hypothetical protein
LYLRVRVLNIQPVNKYTYVCIYKAYSSWKTRRIDERPPLNRLDGISLLSAGKVDMKAAVG